jgi:hypothetical protein
VGELIVLFNSERHKGVAIAREDFGNDLITNDANYDPTWARTVVDADLTVAFDFQSTLESQHG